MEIFWIALGSLTGAGALVWSIFSYTVDRRDKAAKEERQRLDREQEKRDREIKTQLDDLKKKNEKLILEVGNMKHLVAMQNEKLNLYSESFHEEMKRLTVIASLDEGTGKFGNIIKVGVKK